MLPDRQRAISAALTNVGLPRSGFLLTPCRQSLNHCRAAQNLHDTTLRSPPSASQPLPQDSPSRMARALSRSASSRGMTNKPIRSILPSSTSSGVSWQLSQFESSRNDMPKLGTRLAPWQDMTASNPPHVPCKNPDDHKPACVCAEGRPCPVEQWQQRHPDCEAH